MKIYDSFLFFNELDLLEIRLNILYPYVDFFIISEQSKTHSGLEKEWIFEQNKDRFAKFEDKIIYHKQDTEDFEYHDYSNLQLIENPSSKYEENKNRIINFFNKASHFPKDAKHYCRDYLHREMLHFCYDMCDDDDVILISDLDEIPNPKILQNLDKFYDKQKIYRFEQNMYYYYLNVLKETQWKGTTLINKKKLMSTDINSTRVNENFNVVLSYGGWHFSFIGGTEMIKKKIESYGFQEANHSAVKDNIASNVTNLQDLFGRPDTSLQKVEIDNSYPEYIINNKDKLDKFIL
jgi:beta-1,4-mannosyl-glycoprotein beta-1,4-N-acetylglucosaminyltransferase